MDETDVNLEGGDLGDNPTNLGGGDLGDTGSVNTGGGSLGNESDLDTSPNLEGGDLGGTVQTFDDGSTLTLDRDGNVVSFTEATDSTGAVPGGIGSTLKNLGTTAVNQLKSYFQKKDAQGKPIAGQYDWDKIGMVGGLIAKASGFGDVKTPGYKGTVKNFTAVNAPINYNDPNRRPGGAGLNYFTPTQYVPEKGDVAAAQAAANQQAAGILAAYRPATAPVDKWGANAAKPAVAMPWQKKDTGGISSAIAATTRDTPAEAMMTPEEKMALLQTQQTPVKAAMGGIMAAKGRYLRGNTDGMADKINTSIDDRQPAKLSHGEFVVPADVVSHLGNGNSDAGAKKLYQMMDKIRIARTGTKKQGRQINPDKYMPGGSVGYSEGGITDGIQRFVTGGPASGTSTAGGLSEWSGDAITTNIGQGIAAANRGYQGFTGDLSAGASDLQKQQFAGVSDIASTGLSPTQYTTGTFDTAAANKYMNPYLSAALNPQLEEMRRQAQINMQPGLSKLTQAGGFGGGRQAIMESEAARNLLAEQNKTVGQGYANAYDKAMQQYNADMGRGLDTERAQQAANEASANFGLKSLDALAQAGKTQRDIEAEGLAADKKQFEEARDYDLKMAQYKQGLFSGMPVATQVNTQNTNPITDWLQQGSQISKLLESFNKP